MSKSLVTGGLGFIGSHLARQLLKQGEEVIIFAHTSGPKLIEDIKQEVKIVRGDLSNWVEVAEAVKSNHVDCIYHAGAMVSESTEERPSAAYAVNVNGMFHVLEAARLMDVPTVIFTSSVAAFGPGLPQIVPDDTIQKPVSMYGVTKLFGEKLGEYYHRKYGLNFRGIRFPTILGPGRQSGFTGYVSLMVEEVSQGRPFTVPVSEATRMAFLYCKDAVLSLIGLKEADDLCLKRRIYNVQSFSATMQELADTTKRYLPQAQINFCPSEKILRAPTAQPAKMDDSNARKEWRWEPKYDLERAVKDFITEVTANKSAL